jgi:repressor LexA
MEVGETAENGQTVAAWLKAEQEATLKRFYLEDGRVRLQPANSTMQPIYTEPDNVEIKGRVIGVIRRLDNN